MASDTRNGARTLPCLEEAATTRRGRRKPWYSTPEGEDLFIHAHQTLLKTNDHHHHHHHQEQEEQNEGKKNIDESYVKERKRKRKKERIRHIRRVDGNMDIVIHSPHSLPEPLPPFPRQDERLSPPQSSCETPLPPPSRLPLPTTTTPPPLLPHTPHYAQPPPTTLSPSPHPHKHSNTPTPPPLLTPSTSTPSPQNKLWIKVKSPAYTPQLSPPISSRTASSASPPISPPSTSPCLTPTIEETQTEIRKNKKVCEVCGDMARSLHSGGRACGSCRAFFRRAVNGSAFVGFTCVRRSQGGGDGDGGDDGGGDGGDGGDDGGEKLCVVTVKSRKECQACRFVACLKAGMEVPLAAWEDVCSRGQAATPAGLYRRLSRPVHAHANAVHAHINAVHGSPYLAEGWRPSCGSYAPIFAPRQKEEPIRCSPTGGEAAKQVPPVRVAAPPPITSSPVGGYSYPHLQDTALTYALPPRDHHRHAPDEAIQTFRHDSTLASAPSPHALDVTLTHAHESASRRRQVPPCRPRRVAEHTPPPHTTTLPGSASLRRSSPQGPASAARLPPPVTPSSLPSRTTRTSKWPNKSSPKCSTVDSSSTWRPDPPAGGDKVIRKTRSPGAAAHQDALSTHDLTEIQQLQESYLASTEAAALPLEEQRVPCAELGQLYTCFIECRAKFLVSTPLYGTVAAGDRPKLLHVAVAMSTYITGAAHHIDASDCWWRQRRRGADHAGPAVAVLSATSVRQLLSHQQFVHVMKFYTTYGEALADQTVAILMQVMSLFYPEEGLEAPRPVEEGRLHYMGLLSRYLAASHGPREGACRLATLLTGQQEAHQLVQLLRQVDLKPREPRTHLATSRSMLAHRIHLVCQAARAAPHAATDEDDTCPATPLSWDAPQTPQARAAPQTDGAILDYMEKIVNLLAQCEDPPTLAAARRLLPAPLLHRFLDLLLTPTLPPTRPQCTPPSPSPSPPSPHSRKPCIVRHAGEPPPSPPPASRGVPRGVLHRLSAPTYVPDLAAE